MRGDISKQSRLMAGIVLVSVPTVMWGGMALLMLLTRGIPGYSDNPLRQNLFRAGHAHAGVFLILSLVMLRYVDEAMLSPRLKWIVRVSAPLAALFIPAAFFFSVLSPRSTHAGPLLSLIIPGLVLLATGVVALGIGLIRAARAEG
jgi:hypothetical protein